MLMMFLPPVGLLFLFLAVGVATIENTEKTRDAKNKASFSIYGKVSKVDSGRLVHEPGDPFDMGGDFYSVNYIDVWFEDGRKKRFFGMMSYPIEKGVNLEFKYDGYGILDDIKPWDGVRPGDDDGVMLDGDDKDAP
jgi:hypothetical protein